MASNTLKAQEVNYSKPALEAILCKSWIAEYMIMGTTRIDPQPDAQKLIFTFKANGTIETPENTSGPIPEMRWTFMPDQKLIRLYSDDHFMGTISSITNNEMIFNFEPDKDMPVELIGHFKPYFK